jgi:hypothetical protein
MDSSVFHNWQFRLATDLEPGLLPGSTRGDFSSLGFMKHAVDFQQAAQSRRDEGNT